MGGVVDETASHQKPKTWPWGLCRGGGGERIHIFRHILASDWRQEGLVEASKVGELRGGKSETRPQKKRLFTIRWEGLDSPESPGGQYGGPSFLMKSYRCDTK